MTLPKGPRGIPFLGNAVELKADPLGFLTRISREHGDVVRFTLPGQQVYLLNHPDAIEEALKASGDLMKDDSRGGFRSPWAADYSRATAISGAASASSLSRRSTTTACACMPTPWSATPSGRWNASGTVKRATFTTT